MINVAKGHTTTSAEKKIEVRKSRGLDLDNYGCSSNINSSEEIAFISQKTIRDTVFPSIDEIYYCVKNNLVSKKDLLVYKLLIDLNEAIQTEETASKSVSCSLRFYKQLDKQEVECMLAKLQGLCQKMQQESFKQVFLLKSVEFVNSSEAIDRKLVSFSCKDDFIQHYKELKLRLKPKDISKTEIKVDLKSKNIKKKQNKKIDFSKNIIL